MLIMLLAVIMSMIFYVLYIALFTSSFYSACVTLQVSFLFINNSLIYYGYAVREKILNIRSTHSSVCLNCRSIASQWCLCALFVAIIVQQSYESYLQCNFLRILLYRSVSISVLYVVALLLPVVVVVMIVVVVGDTSFGCFLSCIVIKTKYALCLNSLDGLISSWLVIFYLAWTCQRASKSKKNTHEQMR